MIGAADVCTAMAGESDNLVAPVDPSTSGNFLDRHLSAKGEPLRAVARAAVRDIGAIDIRQRRRDREALETHVKLVENIVANLAYSVHAGDPEAEIATLLGKDKVSRYEPSGFRFLSDTLALLEAAGWIWFEKSSERGKASTIKATPKAIQKVLAAKLSFADFGRRDDEEIIQLRMTERGLMVDPATGLPRWGKKGELVDYPETPETRRLREELRAINRHLEQAQLRLVSSHPTIDTTRRRLKRTFAIGVGEDPRFDRSGRLFGGWWQNLKSSERHHIRIDDEPIADLDFSSMFARLAYLEAGERPPVGDLYVIPGLEKHRDGVKRAMSSLMFADMKRLPKEVKELLPANWTGERARQAIFAQHPALEAICATHPGLRLMATESRILVVALTELNRNSVTALPMHDGLMVRASRADMAMDIMRAASKEVVGADLPVARKT